MVEIGIVSVCGNTMCYLNYREAEVQRRRTREVPMVLPEPYFSLSDSRDTSCAIRFFSEPVPQLRDSWDKDMVLPQTEIIIIIQTYKTPSI